MGGFDSATWQALGLTVTLLCLVVTAFVWRRRGPVRGLRALAWSLVPLAAGLTGVLRLGWDIADSVGSWAVRGVFDPFMWLGIAVAGVSAVLFVASGLLGRRKGASKATQKRRAAQQGPQGGQPLPAKGRPPAQVPATTDDDLADIEELLRKHGIS
jgi:heme exporter protein D